MNVPRVGAKDRHRRHDRHRAPKLDGFGVTAVFLGSSPIASPSESRSAVSAAGDDRGDVLVTRALAASSPANLLRNRCVLPTSICGDDGDAVMASLAGVTNLAATRACARG